jgi:hypothetical protein
MKHAIIIILLLFISCAKESIEPVKQEPVSPVTSDAATRTTEKQFDKWLMKYPFIVTQYYIAGTPIAFPQCQLDNILYFKSNNKFVELEGETRCSPTDPDIADYGTWRVSNDTLYLDTHNIPNSAFYIIFHPSKSFTAMGTVLGADLKAVK